MPYRKRIYIEEIPRVSIGKDYRAVEALIANKGGIKMTINDAKKKFVFFFRYYKDFPIPEDGVVDSSIPCNYGGVRYFYVCPCCKRRYKHLYLVRGKKHPCLICRKCRCLSYQSQSENELGSLVLKLYKLLHRYGFKNQCLDDRDRVKGMHNRTHERILKKIRKAKLNLSSYLHFD